MRVDLSKVMANSQSRDTDTERRRRRRRRRSNVGTEMRRTRGVSGWRCAASSCIRFTYNPPIPHLNAFHAYTHTHARISKYLPSPRPSANPHLRAATANLRNPLQGVIYIFPSIFIIKVCSYVYTRATPGLYIYILLPRVTFTGWARRRWTEGDVLSDLPPPRVHTQRVLYNARGT